MKRTGPDEHDFAEGSVEVEAVEFVHAGTGGHDGARADGVPVVVEECMCVCEKGGERERDREEAERQENLRADGWMQADGKIDGWTAKHPNNTLHIHIRPNSHTHRHARRQKHALEADAVHGADGEGLDVG